MASTDQILLDVLDRLDALERDNTVLKRENHALRATVARFTGGATASPESAADASDAPLSRRQVLRRAAQVTAATVAAGAMLQHDSRGTAASHSSETVNANIVDAHQVRASSQGDGNAIIGFSNSDEAPTIYGNNQGSSAGVQGTNAGSGHGVEGQSDSGRGVYGVGVYGVHGFTEDGDIGVYGENIGIGPGVIGDGKGANHAGVMGRNSTGDGVHGEGKIGVRATSTTSGGYGAVIEGGKAQLRVVPKTTAGKPTSGAHSKGELFLDTNATLWICTVSGTPGTWRRFTTTAT